jgi:uncharacterized membrane protein (DUF485 family)
MDFMQPSQPERTSRILANPAFRELVSARAKLRWSLAIVTLVMFFGFITLISTSKGALGATVTESEIPLGRLIALAMIAIVVILTGIYVQQSNTRFDELSRTLNREFGQ